MQYEHMGGGNGGECVRSASVKQDHLCCHALPLDMARQRHPSVMVTSSSVFQNRPAPSGRALRRSGRLNSELCPALLFSPNTATGNLLYLGKDRPLFSHNNMKDRKSWALPVQAGWKDFGALELTVAVRFQMCSNSRPPSILLPKHSCICVMEMPI